MSKANEYRLNAAECARQAEVEQDIDKKARLLRMGESWLTLAENEEHLAGTVITIPPTKVAS